MKTNEVQKVSEHFKKSLISVSHLETARIEGGRAPYFFHKILLRSFVTVNSPSRTHRGSIPRCFPTHLSGQMPGSFPTLLHHGPCHRHRLVRGVNPILWMGLSWSNSFFGTSRLAAVGSTCLHCWVPGSTLGCHSLPVPFTFLPEASRIIAVDVPRHPACYLGSYPL